MIKKLVAFAGVMFSLSANAGMVNGGSLMTSADADQFELWLGLGDEVNEFKNIWTGIAGVSTTEEFHEAVDYKGPTISIYGIRFQDGSEARVGGYTSLDWDSLLGGYFPDSTAFLFNLTTGETQFNQALPANSVYQSLDTFSTFGSGFDLFGGIGILGTCNGYGFNDYNAGCSGYSFSHSYDTTKGLITAANDSGYGNSGTPGYAWVVTTLEVYTFGLPEPEVIEVNEPGAPLLFGLGLLALGLARRKTK